MKNIDVVTKASILGDTTVSISIPEKNDVRYWFNEFISPERDSLQNDIEQLKKNLNEERLEANKIYNKLNETLNEHKAAIHAVRTEIKENVQKTNNVTSRVTALENETMQWESRFKTLSEKLCSNFIEQCRADVEVYFSCLADEAKKLQEESQKIIERQQIISNQLELAAKIAEFFSKQYETQLSNYEETMSNVMQLQNALENWKNKKLEK